MTHHIGTHVEGFRLSVLGPDLWLADGGEVGPAHGQQSPTTARAQTKRVESSEIPGVESSFHCFLLPFIEGGSGQAR